MSFKKIDYIENNHESRITRLEVTIENINQTLSRMEKRFDNIDSNFLDMRKEMLEIRKEGWSQFKWLFSLYTAGAISLLGVMARGFHWI